MTSSDLWDDETARRYDESSAEMFAPDVLGPTVDLLADLAGDGRALELAVESRHAGFGSRTGGQRVLHHGVGGVLTNGVTQIGDLRHGETAVLRQHGSIRVAEVVRKLGNGCILSGGSHARLLRW